MQEEQLLCILKQMQDVCKLINPKTKHNNPNSKLVYEVLQLSDLAKSNQKDPRKVIKTIADFYNLNWKGNADFMQGGASQQNVGRLTEQGAVGGDAQAEVQLGPDGKNLGQVRVKQGLAHQKQV